MPDSGALGNAVKFIGDFAVLPGTSQLLDGDIRSGVVHVAIGTIAGAVLGLPGFMLIAANSYSQSVSDKSLFSHVKEVFSGVRPTPAPAPATAGEQAASREP